MLANAQRSHVLSPRGRGILCLSRLGDFRTQSQRDDSTGSLFRSFPPHEVPNSAGGSFAATWARMVLKRCSSGRGERWTAAVSSVLDFKFIYLFTYF